MDLTTIIAEADIRVPNVFSSAQKVDWLNHINGLFFEVVKIPKVATFNTVAGTPSYSIAGGVKEKNITKVQVGNGNFKSLSYEEVNPGNNYFIFNDGSNQITLSPVPTRAQSGYVRYDSAATTSFVSTSLTAKPDAPEQYHWIYILGLCEHIAKAMNDVSLANNYAQEFQANLLMAQQNYARG